MNRIPRFIIWIIASILIISSLLFIYYNYFNKNKTFDPQALSNNIPVVISSNEPLGFIHTIKNYSDIDGILPVNQIVSTETLFNNIANNNISILKAAWLQNPTDDHFAVLIAAEKDITDLISNNADDSPSWFTSKEYGFTLCAKSKESLSFFGERITGYGAAKIVNEDKNNLIINNDRSQFENFSEKTSVIFDIIEYQNTLFINGTPLDWSEGMQSSGAKIPISGALSDPELYAGNPLCIIQYSKNKENPVVSIQLSSGNAAPVQSIASAPEATPSAPNAIASLANPIKRGPFLVDNHKTGGKGIIAFDIKNTMYMFDIQGTLLWKKQFPDEITGQVFQVDKFNNGKFQYLWNSKNNLHLIDVEGNEVEGYPFTLPGATRKGISLIHFKGYTYPNIIYVSNDGKVMNLNLSPAIVPDWHLSEVNFPVSEPISYLNSGSDHYVIVAGDNGEVTMLRRTGEVRMRIKKSFVNNSRSDFYVNTTNSKGNLITTNNKGTLIYIPKTGGVASTKFGSFSEEHFFFYMDFDHDKNNDFVFVDKNKITAYNRFKKEIFSQQLDYNIIIKPQVLTFNRKTYLGIVNSTTGEFNLFNSDGRLNKTVPCEEHIEIDYNSQRVYSAVGKNIYKNTL